METIKIGEDINGKPIYIVDKVKRDDGVVGSFDLRDFELCFDYEEVQKNGAMSCYINHGRQYEII